MTQGNKIVEAARVYLDVPFVEKGRGMLGMDCAGLVICVAADLELRDRHGRLITRDMYPDYGSQPQGNKVQTLCREHLFYIAVRDIQAGSVITMAIPRDPCHLGIVGVNSLGIFTVIHAYAGGAQKVVEHELNYRWHNRIVGAFVFPGVQ